MVTVLCVFLAIGYWLGGRRPLRVIDAQRRWGARHWRTTAFGAGHRGDDSGERERAAPG